MTMTRFATLGLLGIAVWALLLYAVFTYSPRTHNQTGCQELTQPDQDKCKTRRKL